MKKLPVFAVLALLVLVSGAPALAQSSKSFQGEWEWAIYAKSRAQLPPIYRNEPLRDVPGAAIYLKIRQRGNKLDGAYSANRRFLARLEDGEFDSVVRGNRTTLELVSGFQGTLTVLLTRSGNRLHWRTITSAGEYYFPGDVYLQRVIRKRRRS
jgi:hypothetical protein